MIRTMPTQTVSNALVPGVEQGTAQSRLAHELLSLASCPTSQLMTFSVLQQTVLIGLAPYLQIDRVDLCGDSALRTTRH